MPRLLGECTRRGLSAGTAPSTASAAHARRAGTGQAGASAEAKGRYGSHEMEIGNVSSEHKWLIHRSMNFRPSKRPRIDVLSSRSTIMSAA
jgi:hypothetical protein